METIHIAISVHNVAASVEDYSKRFAAEPCVIVPNEYALWRNKGVNFSIRQTNSAHGTLRHLGWEDSTAIAFTKETDVNGNAMAQADEIGNIWPSVDYLPSKIEQE